MTIDSKAVSFRNGLVRENKTHIITGSSISLLFCWGNYCVWESLEIPQDTFTWLSRNMEEKLSHVTIPLQPALVDVTCVKGWTSTQSCANYSVCSSSPTSPCLQFQKWKTTPRSNHSQTKQRKKIFMFSFCLFNVRK